MIRRPPRSTPLSLHDALPISIFAFSEVRLGISPATIAPFVLRKIGPSHTRALFLTGERFDVQRAQAIGLVHVVDRKSTRLNSSHANISYAVFCLKKKKQYTLQ